MESIFSVIFYVAVFISICALASKRKKQQKAAEQAAERKQAVRRFEQAGREVRESFARAAAAADPDMVKQVGNEVSRNVEAWRRHSYSIRTPEQRKADRTAGHAALEDSGLQDEKHDWLARQMAEEQKAYREVSEMFEAKLSHMSSCAAENNRLDHVLRCDARKLAEETRNM